MARILISGSSGFIGSALTKYLLSKGHSIVKLKRGIGHEPDVIYWDPERAHFKKEDFEGFDAVINLAGEPFSFTRWSKEKKRKILFSRTICTAFLSEIISQTTSFPKVFISASAIGFYGDKGEVKVNEKSVQGDGFLSKVSCQWERAANSHKRERTRVVCPRFAMVIGQESRSISHLILLYKLGFGGKIGSGQQWVSFVDIEDLLRALEMIIHNKDVEGPVNISSPYPVRQKDFSKILASLLNRPSFFTLPKWFIRAIFGTLAEDILLASCRVEPEKLKSLGFEFLFPKLQDSLKKALTLS